MYIRVTQMGGMGVDICIYARVRDIPGSRLVKQKTDHKR